MDKVKLKIKPKFGKLKEVLTFFFVFIAVNESYFITSKIRIITMGENFSRIHFFFNFNAHKFCRYGKPFKKRYKIKFNL